MPKLRLAKISGFEGLQKLEMQIEIETGYEIDLNEEFKDEVGQRVKNQNDLLFELCKSEEFPKENPYKVPMM
jgi:hypothetical protein